MSVFLALAIAPQTAQPADAKADLKVIDSTDYPWHSIGRVNRAGYKSVSSCTGTLIAPNLVLTAAHCIVSPKTKKKLPADEVLFIAGVRRDQYAARLEAECLLVPEGYVPAGRPKISNIHKDLGLIVLKEPSTLFPLPPLTPDESRRLRQTTRFLSVGYRRSRPYLPTVVSSCSVLGSQEDVWITDCNTESGASGGPLMVNTIFGPRVAAVMSSKINDERSIVVPFPEWQDLIASASCEGEIGDEVPLTGKEEGQQTN
ncbi:MAG: trypsin-like peptidase domain-containing protein [Pseudomonadota bacterium]